MHDSTETPIGEPFRGVADRVPNDIPEGAAQQLRITQDRVRLLGVEFQPTTLRLGLERAILDQPIQGLARLDDVAYSRRGIAFGARQVKQLTYEVRESRDVAADSCQQRAMAGQKSSSRL